MKIIVCGTGHRPEDMPISEINVRSLIRLKLQWNLEKGDDIESIITGMAAGFDLWFADEAMGLGLPVIAARPWAGHKPRRYDEDLYKHVIDNATKVVDVSVGKVIDGVQTDVYPGTWVYRNRNHWMVDNATHLLAYYNGAEKGGTAECYAYVKLRQEQGHNIKIYNLINDPPF